MTLSAQLSSWTVALLMAAVVPVQSVPETVPLIFPQVFGGFTVMATVIGSIWYGVSWAIVSHAVYVPGWTISGPDASTVTVFDAPGARVSAEVSSDSQEASDDVPHWP